MPGRAVWTTSLLAGSLLLAGGQLLAAPPGEVGSVGFGSDTTIVWGNTAGATSYNVYRGLVSQQAAGVPPRCHRWAVAGTSVASADLPPVGSAFLYLVTGVNTDGEGTAGNASSGSARAVLSRCSVVMEHHLIDRISYGWNDYVKDRIAAAGLQGFLNEQLNPAAISESTNSELNTRLNSLTPPISETEMAYRQMTMAVYARRQLEQVVAEFWNNHFSTDFQQVHEAYFTGDATGVSRTADAQYREMEHFRWYAFHGNFRDIVEMSALGPAMIPYLDTNENVLGRPNENFARELMELHTMGVDGGYTQTDVREMARVWTGWTLCRKNFSNELTLHVYADPAAACAIVSGKYTGHFDYTKHDCAAKTLFAGTAQQLNIPSTCNGTGQPQQSGINDAYLALDAVANHPSTQRFIATKLLQKFVTETPSLAMIQQVVDRWNLTGGDNLEVLKSVLDWTLLMDPDKVSNKIKTPFEQFAATYRATRSDTNDTNLGTLYSYLARMQMLPHQKSEPTGFGELSKDWINTNDLLERQNFAWDVTTRPLTFFEDIIPLLAANGLSAASPPGSLVDFYAKVLFGGAITPHERQRLIDFLTSDDSGVPAAVNDDRIRKLVALMLGMAQTMEQ